MSCHSPTLNVLLIKSNHYQVRFIKGEGCRSRYWNPQIMEVDLKDGKITGHNVTVKVIDKRTKKVISTHTVVAWPTARKDHIFLPA